MLRLLPADSVTEHTIDTPRGKLCLHGNSRNARLFMTNPATQSASVFYTAYVQKKAVQRIAR